MCLLPVDHVGSDRGEWQLCERLQRHVGNCWAAGRVYFCNKHYRHQREGKLLKMYTRIQSGKVGYRHLQIKYLLTESTLQPVLVSLLVWARSFPEILFETCITVWVLVNGKKQSLHTRFFLWPFLFLAQISESWYCIFCSLSIILIKITSHHQVKGNSQQSQMDW